MEIKKTIWLIALLMLGYAALSVFLLLGDRAKPRNGVYDLEVTEKFSSDWLDETFAYWESVYTPRRVTGVRIYCNVDEAYDDVEARDLVFLLKDGVTGEILYRKKVPGKNVRKRGYLTVDFKNLMIEEGHRICYALAVLPRLPGTETNIPNMEGSPLAWKMSRGTALSKAILRHGLSIGLTSMDLTASRYGQSSPYALRLGNTTSRFMDLMYRNSEPIYTIHMMSALRYKYLNGGLLIWMGITVLSVLGIGLLMRVGMEKPAIWMQVIVYGSLAVLIVAAVLCYSRYVYKFHPV